VEPHRRRFPSCSGLESSRNLARSSDETSRRRNPRRRAYVGEWDWTGGQKTSLDRQRR
jgi:hypothetical protein